MGEGEPWCSASTGYRDRRDYLCSADSGFVGLEICSRALSSMNDLSPQREIPDSLMLFGFWYRALAARDVGRNHLKKAMLLEIPLVVGRDRQGHPFAMQDACPHRGMPLSYGRFDGHQLECSYHGWTFDTHTGQCRLIPSLT